ncbi:MULTISPECIES: restriction endonuclease subunit S [Ralstonia solanacearum species complex]|uniref:restriction endonuclease subunit S n=1 Tax=Ralstonia solanacearum species complex TaxID=3116862 RepID=UPI0013C2C53C|nr:restriction endonuclease subunit S [Ralstonia solanacearum]BEU72578.1 restriction endonuclease subunit S [Ralstonia pseudosolanacearum]
MSSKNKAATKREEVKPALGPKLRFPEFQNAGDWTTEVLRAVATIRTEKVGNNICVPMSITSGVGLVSQEEKFGRVIAGDSYKNYLLLKPNEFAYNKSATKEYPEGFLTLYSGTELAAVPNSIFTCFRINGDSPDVRFLNYQFSDNLHGRWLRKFIQVGARAHGSLSINDNDLMALPVPVPTGTTSVAEQQKIAECLSSVDELIAAQAAKVAALKTHKKGLMQQLFPREGETRPRLRFPEFQNAGEWETTELGDCLEKVIDYRGKPPPKAESGVPLITAKNVRFGWLDMTADEYIEAGAYGAWMTKGIPKAGDILFTTEAPLGNVAMFPSVGVFALGQRIITLRCNTKKCVPEFLFQSLLGPEMQKTIDFHSTGSTAKGIKSSVFVTLCIRHPKVEEQQRIASFLSTLDALITAEAQKLEAFKSHKKGLMQNLFPSSDEVDV